MNAASPPPCVPRFKLTLPPVILGIALVCVAVEGVLLGADWGLWGSPRWRLLAWQNGGFWIGLLGNWRPNYTGQPLLMFFTYGFLHGGPGHMIFNMITLISLGIPVCARLGAARFAALYAFSILGGALGFALLASAVQPMVGASGALFGLAGAWLAWDYRDRRMAALKLWPVLRAVAGLALLNGVMYWAMGGLLAWETHLGGFIAGWVAALALDPKETRHGPRG